MTTPGQSGSHAFARTRGQRFMFHAPNPLVRGILRSPAHRVLSGKLLLLTYTGRRTGSRHTIPVAYTHDGGDLCITVGWPERKLWWRNLREPGSRVTATVHGSEQELGAEVQETAEAVVVRLRHLSRHD